MHIFCNAPGPDAYYAIKDWFIHKFDDKYHFCIICYFINILENNNYHVIAK